MWFKLSKIKSLLRYNNLNSFELIIALIISFTVHSLSYLIYIKLLFINCTAHIRSLLFGS